MKKILLGIVLLGQVMFVWAQQPSLTLSLNASKVVNNQVKVSIMIDELTSDLLVGQWFILYDTELLKYDHAEDFNTLLPKDEWVFGDMDGDLGFNWIPGDLVAKNVEKGSLLCVLVFDVLKKGKSTIRWNMREPGVTKRQETLMWNNNKMEYLLELNSCTIGE